MRDADLASFVRGLPKAELHLHIEGTLEPEMLIDLAGRNGVDLPFEDEAAVRAAYSFADLLSFLDIYYQGAAVLQTEQDFYDLTAAYLRRAHTDGVRRAEMFFDPQTHTERGVGLDSSEVDHPPEDFAQAYAMARAAGLRPVAHAGEEGPPAYIAGALDALGAERIDHGVRCEEDPALVVRLVEAQTPLTVCPLSNLALCVVDDLAEHNLKRLLDAGLKVTINSDDPAYFGGYVADNYLAAAQALGLTRDELALCARNSLEACFAPDAQRQAWLAELDAYLDAG